MMKSWRNRKKWRTRRKLLLQGRLDMLPLDQAWAEVSERQFADLVARSATPTRAVVPASVSSGPRDGYALGDPKRIAFESRNW